MYEDNNLLFLFSNSNDGNISYSVGDDTLNVDKNRNNLALKYKYESNELVYMEQVHGNNVQIVTKESPKLIEKCDGLITNEKNLPLMVMVADCIPILLYDEKKEVIAALHAGRNSTFQEIVKIALEKMIDIFDCKVKDIKAIFGPSIQKCCYEVSAELLKIVKSSFGEEFIYTKNINLQGINKKLLENMGVKDIEISELCTKCSNQSYFSYRKNKKTGRFAAVIMLKKRKMAKSI